MSSAFEVNFDGIVGPTHNYAGLSFGNLASMSHRRTVSHPRQAALEGLGKMKLLSDLGIRQAVLPPHPRPSMRMLRSKGFVGNDAQIIEKASQTDPALLAAASSASSMWAANAATVSPSTDCADGRVHFTPANLISNPHRAIEAPMTTRILRTIFADESHFIVHDPLPADPKFADEGAANHMRLCSGYGEPGTEIFIFGRRGDAPSAGKFPARQSYEASAAIASQHQLRSDRTLFLQQSPAAIDAGVFHNDVIAVGNQDVLLLHEQAYAEPDAIERITRSIGGDGVRCFPASMPIADVVGSYLFNSQLVSLPDGSMILIAPAECREFPRVQEYLATLTAPAGPVKTIHYVDVRQSMRNGGGPACLRLRVVLTEAEFAHLGGNVILTPELYEQLRNWIMRHYREQLAADGLKDPRLLHETNAALAELATILQLGAIFADEPA